MSEIIFTHQPLEQLTLFLASRKYSDVVCIVDENTEKHCLPLFQNLFKEENIIRVTSGEEQKNLNTCTQIWERLTALELDRKAVVVNLGGGVIGDMGGFCAATYKRGIDFIQIPTTLLSQVDASVGGKLGIDFHSFKNHIGVFQVPQAVIISPVFLKTLSPRELRSGFAEVIKHALIADANAWDALKTKTLEEQNWDEVIPHSVAIKSKVVEADPTEKGLRKILNYGHTLGHAVESFFLENNNRILHGEAIAIGMITETYMAVQKKFILESDLIEIQNYILKIYGFVKIPAEHLNYIISLTKQDKKNEKGAVLFSLLNKKGEANFNIQANDEEMLAALTYYNSLQA